MAAFLILEQQPNVGDSENQEEVVDIEPVQRILHSVKYEKDDLKSRVQQKHQEVPRGFLPEGSPELEYPAENDVQQKVKQIEFRNEIHDPLDRSDGVDEQSAEGSCG